MERCKHLKGRNPVFPLDSSVVPRIVVFSQEAFGKFNWLSRLAKCSRVWCCIQATFESCRKRFFPNPSSFLLVDKCYWHLLFHVGALTASPSEALHSWDLMALWRRECLEKVMVLLPQLEDTWREPFGAVVTSSNQDFGKGRPLRCVTEWERRGWSSGIRPPAWSCLERKRAAAAELSCVLQGPLRHGALLGLKGPL